MKKGGWFVDDAMEYDNVYSANCIGYGAFWGYKLGWAVGSVVASFKGSGRGTLDFGNCFSDGFTKVYLNGNLISSAGKNQKSKVANFKYNKGDVLEIKEEETGIIKINSFKLEGCEKEGNIVL